MGRHGWESKSVIDVRLTCQPGDPGRPNEDSVVAVPGLLAVLDGVTSPDGMDTGCVHGPAWYARRLAANLAERYLAAPGTDLADLVATAIAAVRDEHGGECDLDHPGTPQSTLAALRIAPEHCDHFLLGDSTILLDRGGTVQAITDLRSHEVARRVRGPAPADPSRIGSSEHAERIRAGIVAMRRHANQPGAYWIAAADPAAARHAVRGRVSRGGRRGLARAALASDGASCVVDQYGLTDWRGLLDLIESYGAGHIVGLARAVERADPDGRTRPRAKRHDDATVAYCRLAGDPRAGTPAG